MGDKKKPDKKKTAYPQRVPSILKLSPSTGSKFEWFLGAEIRVMWPKLVRPNLDCPIRTVTVLQFKNGRSSKCEQFHESVV